MNKALPLRLGAKPTLPSFNLSWHVSAMALPSYPLRPMISDTYDLGCMTYRLPSPIIANGSKVVFYLVFVVTFLKLDEIEQLWRMQFFMSW